MSEWKIDDVHVLRVQGDDREVVHLESCPTEGESGEPFAEEVWVSHVCPVGIHVSHWGWDDLTDEVGHDVSVDDLPPGDYPLVLRCYTPDSMYEDADVEFTLGAQVT